MVTIMAMTLRRALASSLLVIILHMLILGVANGEVVNEGDGGGEGKVSSSKLAVIEFRSPNLYPESFDWDAKHNRFLVGSMGHGKLVTVTLDGVVEEFATYGGGSQGVVIAGVTVDATRNRVLAVVHGWKGPALDALVAYDLESKERTLFVDLGDSARSVLENQDVKEGRPSSNDVANDVAVDLEGNAYVTNSGGNYVWKVTAEGLKAVIVGPIPQLPVIVDAESQISKVDPVLVKLTEEAGTNGIVYTDGYILISQSNSGALFRVTVTDGHHQDERVRAVKITDGQTMPGADGLALRPDGSLVVASVHTVWLLTSKDSWRTATVVDQVPLNIADFTTTVAVVGHRVFTVQFHGLDLVKGIDRELFTIREVAFPYEVDNNPLWLLVIAAAFIVLIIAWRFQLKQFNTTYTKKRL